MRKLLTAVIGAMVGATLVAGTGYGAGPIYTIPATYEKVEKLAQGIAGRDLNTIDPDRALNTGANVRAFIQGATGKDVGSTYSPTYFTAYGNNYRQFVKNAVGVDVGGTTSSTSFANAGNNYRSLAQGMTGLYVSGNYAYYYSNAGRNTRNFLYNVAGSNPNYYSNSFTYAGRNLRYGFYYLTDSSITSSSGYSAVYSKVRQKIDQLTYDMYVNPDGLKKAFSSMDSRISNITQNLKPVSTTNKVDTLGGESGDFWYNSFNGDFRDKKGNLFHLSDYVNFVFRDYRSDYPVGKTVNTASGQLKSVVAWVKKGYTPYGDYCGHDFGINLYLNGVKILYFERYCDSPNLSITYSNNVYPIPNWK